MSDALDFWNEREIFQWFLDAEPVGMSLGTLVSVEGLVAAVQSIVFTSRDAEASPANVAAAWNALCGAIGPGLTNALVESEDWMCLTPPPESSGPLGTVVWEKGDRRVVGRQVVRDGRIVNYEFLTI